MDIIITNVMKLFTSIVIAISFLLTGCTGEEEITEIANPELVAVAFFDALYNQKDVKKAASVCSPKLARILLHYKSPTAVGRHLFNMQYDKVEIKPDDSGVKVREQFKDDADIILYFDGYYQEDRIKDVKRVSLKQVDGNWVIDKILKDPF
ncbi:hypothetical protein [Thalassotalea algicola]|nr:hypothetical protein [Thalassotalea algicola]